MIGTVINGYKVVATGITGRDTSVLLGINTHDQGDKYVVASIATKAVLESAEKSPTFWSNGNYTSNLETATAWYLADVETDPFRFWKHVGQIDKDLSTI